MLHQYGICKIWMPTLQVPWDMPSTSYYQTQQDCPCGLVFMPWWVRAKSNPTVWLWWLCLVLACPPNSQSDKDLGNLVAGSMPWHLCQVSSAILQQLLWCCSEHCPDGEALPSGIAVAMKGSLKRWVVHAKWNPLESQDPRPNRTLHCYKKNQCSLMSRVGWSLLF